MRKADATPYLWMYDVHGGLEKKEGRTVTTHNRPAIKAVLEFMESLEPRIFGFGGDQLDCGEISHHNSKKPRLVEGFRFKDTLDMFNEEVLRPVEQRMPKKNARKIWHRGNHERFLQDFLDANPAYEGLLSIEDYLDLTARGWEIYDFAKISTIGKCSFVHGEKLTSKYPAQQALEMYRRNIRFGHRHSSSCAVDRQCYDKPNDRHSAKGIPCLRTLDPAWLQHSTNNWINGFLYGYVKADGSFTDHVVEMVKNKFVIDGLEYDGRAA